MKTIKLFAAAVIGTSLFFSSCKEESTIPPSTTPGGQVKSGMITADETWTADKIYVLSNKVVVDEGVTLTIEPGTIIKGKAGQGSLAAALVVARGGKLMAEGTVDNPIIFTSEADNIMVGEKVGSNLTKVDNKLWGGVIICGKAPISAENGDTETNIEGIPAEDGFGLYGGNNPADNSGVIKYVSIRHGGISIGEGNEINGLTLGGVGSGTVVENIEVYATLDDGIECFGGTVNINKALVFYQGDDGLDLDMNYAGTISEFAVIHGDGIGTDEGLEIDGPEGSTYTDGLFTLMNGIVKSEGTGLSPADLKSKAQGNIKNVSFIGYAGKELKFRTKFDGSCGHKEDAYSHLVDANPTLIFMDNVLDATKVYDGDEDLGATPPVPTTCPTELAAAQAAAAGKVSGNGAGSSIDIATLFSWTAAGQNGEL